MSIPTVFPDDVRRVLVCGGRHYDSKSIVWSVLDQLQPDFVIHGDCHVREGDKWVRSGADRWADEWAFSRGIPVARVPADWSIGRRAGPIRNMHMLKLQPTLVVAFPGGNGTDSMVRFARRSSVRVLRVREDGAVQL